MRGDFEEFARETGRELKLEIEPGTFLVANAGSLVCTVQVWRMTVRVRGGFPLWGGRRFSRILARFDSHVAGLRTAVVDPFPTKESVCGRDV